MGSFAQAGSPVELTGDSSKQVIAAGGSTQKIMIESLTIGSRWSAVCDLLLYDGTTLRRRYPIYPGQFLHIEMVSAGRPVIPTDQMTAATAFNMGMSCPAGGSGSIWVNPTYRYVATAEDN